MGAEGGREGGRAAEHREQGGETEAPFLEISVLCRSFKES